MSETPGQTFWSRLRYTPVRDLLRGQWTARLDPARQLHNSGLPEPVLELLQNVIQGTGLWRFEKAAVLDELIAHFKDGLEAGAPVEQLVSEFGEPPAAAKLIRRAVRRNRPLPWQAGRAVGWSGMALLGFYLLYSIHFVLGKPSIITDHVAELNARAEATPIEQRAWPLYRKALLGLNSIAELPRSIVNAAGAIRDDVGPGHRDWPQLAAYIAAHQEQIALIREAAAKPVFGFILGARGSAQDAELFPPGERKPAMSPREDLAGMALPSLILLRKLSSFLATDLALAREQGDSRRLVQNAESLLGLARQLREYGVILLDLVSIAVHTKAVEQLSMTLRDTPRLFTDVDLTTLAHQLARENTAADLLPMQVERATFEDILQRSFSDDGNGDGRLTLEGFEYVMRLSYFNYDSGLHTLLSPAAGLMISSRKRLSAEHERLIRLAEANLRLPIRVADWSALRDNGGGVGIPFALGGDRLAHRFTPYYRRLHAAAEQLLGHRDGLLVAISLELFRRRNQQFPETLEALVGGFLPQVPADRATGEPVKLRLVNESPVVYSVGGDRDDDGGRPALNKTGLQPAAVSWLDGGEIFDGDWLLYPVTTQR